MEILWFFAVAFLNNKIIDILNLTQQKNRDKVVLYLIVSDILNHYCWNYRPSKLLFSFMESYICNINKRKTKMALVLKTHNSESYNKTENFG